jgi:hypothetical protein
MITVYYDFEYSKKYVKDKEVFETYGHCHSLVYSQGDGTIHMNNFDKEDKKTARKAAIEILDELIKQKKLISYKIKKVV